MHRLVQGQHEEALPESGELPLPALGWRFRRLVEVRLAQRLQKLQVLFAQLKILLSNLGEGWIPFGIGDGFRALTEKLLPFCPGILISQKCRGTHAPNQCEMPHPPRGGPPAVRRWKRRCGAAHLVDYT